MVIQATVNARIRVPGIEVELVDYRWRRGAEIVAEEPAHILRRRSAPSRLGVSALVGGSEKPFGHLMFFPAHVPVRTGVAANDECIQTILCRFDKDWFTKTANMPAPDDWDADDLARCLAMQNGRIDQAIRWMGLEVSAPGLASELLIDSMGSMIAVELARHFVRDVKQLRVRTCAGKLIPSHLRRVLDYIDSAPNKCPTIEEIAIMCDVSAAHLRRAFKNTTGHTIHQYVETTRLQKAKALLSETDYPLKEISYRLGFAASSTFSSVFRKAQGETPSEYRCRARH